MKRQKKNEKIPVFEDNNGSYFIEAEDGVIRSPISVFFDETASGEKYISAESGTGRNLDPYNKKPNVRYKFYVKEKGTFKLWIRYFSPDSSKKSCWIGIDGKNWSEHNTGNTSEFTWAQKKVLYLDKGWHTIDWQYREWGQKIDCFALVKADTKEMYDYKMTGLGALPGEQPRPSALTYAQRKIPKLYFNNEELKSNWDIERSATGEYLVPIQLLADKMEVEYYKGDGYILLTKDRNYLKVIPGDFKAVTNGNVFNMSVAPYMKDTALIMDLDAFLHVFGGKYETADGIRLDITLSKTDEYEQSELIEIYNLDSQSVSYKIPVSNEAAKVIPYVLWSGETGWRKGTSLSYKDGFLYGSFTAMKIADGQSGIIKLKVIEDNKVTWHYKNFNTVSYNGRFPTVYDFIPHEEGLYLVPTFESMSYYLDVDNDNYKCDITFREIGQKEWKKAYTPYWDDLNRQFRGVIVYLKQDTEYEVRAELSFNGKVVRTESNTVRTWTDNPPIAAEYKLSDIYDPTKDEGSLVLENLKGSPDGWIRIYGEEGNNTISASKNIMSAVYIANSEYIILENLKIRGGEVNGVEFGCNSENVRIENCDISGWGRYGVLNPKSGLHINHSGSSINLEAGVKLFDCKNIVVERTYFHDPDGRTNDWRWGHPCGMTGILLRSRGGTVIRYNDFIGSDESRWNDAIECYSNGHISGGPARDTDIYGNILLFSNDDAIEFDGGQMNLRFYNNKIEGTYCGVSTVPLTVGPSYMFRNIFTNMGDARNATSNATKNGGGEGRKWNYSRIYFFNNTVYTTGTCIGTAGWTGAADDARINYITRNNILISGDAASSYAIKDIFQPITNSFDHDLIRTVSDQNAQVLYSKGNEPNGVFESPQFVSKNDGIYQLSSASPAIDRGTVVDNFSDVYSGKAPDIGALEYGDEYAKKSIPARPIDVWSEKYQVNLDTGISEDTVKIHIGDIGEDMDYELLVSSKVGWLAVSNENGTSSGIAKPNSVITVNVKGNTALNSGFSFANGSFLFRLKNGYSIPVTVYGGKY